MKRMQNQAKSVSKRTWREKGTYVKKKLAVISILPDAGTFADNYF